MRQAEAYAVRRRKPASRWLVALLVVAVAAGAAGALAGFGHRWGWWDYRTGFTILRWAAYVAAGAALIALVAFVAAAVYKHTANALLALLAAIVATALVLPAWQMQRLGASVPRINDITTDTERPPEFVAIVPLRRGAPNPPEYSGAKTAQAQKEAYADIAPAHLALPPAEAYRRALATAKATGWDIVAEAPADGRIEATATTFWFGFKDDVVIRVTPEGNGSRVDVRSKSRVGRNDFGANAKRVRSFLRELTAS